MKCLEIIRLLILTRYVTEEILFVILWSTLEESVAPNQQTSLTQGHPTLAIPAHSLPP